MIDKYDRSGRAAIQTELTRDEDQFLTILGAISD
jgi:hypothetical protein